MAITNINPVDDAVVRPGDSFSFDIDDTYTAITIEVIRDSGTEFAYDGTLGGAQAGYTVSVSDDGAGTHTFTVSRSAGWDQDPQQIRVVEDETGAEATTTWNYYLTDTALYPEGMNPYNLEHEGTLIITQDEVLVRDDVTWIDIVGADSNVTVEDLGVGKVRITITDSDTIPGGGDDYTEPVKLDTTYSPVGLWLLNGDLTNSGSATLGDLDFETSGTVYYAQGYEKGTLGAIITGTSEYFGAAYDADLEIAGDYTFQAIIMNTVEVNWFSRRGQILTCENRTGGAQNALFANQFYDLDDDGKFLSPAYQDDNNALVSATPNVITRGAWQHVVWRRSVRDIDMWVNGKQVYGPTTTGSILPTASGDDRVIFGASKYSTGTGVPRMQVDCMKLVDSALSDAQIAAEFALTGLG